VSVWVCLRCGIFKREGWWFECASCGYAPEDPENLTKQLLASDDEVSPRLEEIARKVKAGERVEFHPEEIRANWTTKEKVLQEIADGEVIERGECPKCGKRIRHVSDGLDYGLVCSACEWSLWTTDPRAVPGE
jgi:hypothetical protein